MTIHSEHPFATPDSERDQARRFRGRLGGTVALATTSAGSQRHGLTVSSLMMATGAPAHVVALLDPDAAFTEVLLETRVAVIQVLEWRHRKLADAFAGVFPAPGGAFRMAEWASTPWGPRLVDASAWCGVRLVDGEPTEVGWSVLVDGVVEKVQLLDEMQPLIHRRGRYQRPE
ncbi:MAG: flavin reductase family protein [Nocardioidaceae bacterium]